MQPDFTVNSRYDEHQNFTNVRFGANAKVLECELNELQDIQNEARANLVRETIPSGFTKLSPLDYKNMRRHAPNILMMAEDSVAFVNGYKIDIPKETIIQLSDPPTKDFVSCTGEKGTREDLVFLEVWKEEVTCNDKIMSDGKVEGKEITNSIKDNRIGSETSRRVQLKYRLRVVDDVDFKIHPCGLRNVGERWESLGVLAQCGRTIPLNLKDGVYTNPITSVFCQAHNDTDMKVQYGGIKLDDVGLYVAGDGSKNSKSILKSIDGYVYAIPMFRIHRRNDGGYSCINGNGAGLGYKVKSIPQNNLNGISMKEGEKGNIIFHENITNIFKVDDMVYRTSDGMAYTKVSKIIDNTTIELETLQNCSVGYGNEFLYTKTRPDRQLANIITERDIVDLRHQVSLTGFDYTKLLEDNFQRLLMGKLETKERTKMLKTYHGIPKTPIDSNTVFYASFDGTTVAEVGGKPKKDLISKYGFCPMPTGLGIDFHHDDPCELLEYGGMNIHDSDFTIDLTFKSSLSNKDWGIYVGSSDKKSILRVLGVVDGYYQIAIYLDGTPNTSYSGGNRITKNINHIRIRYIKSENKLIYYLNGKPMKTLEGKDLEKFKFKTTPIENLWMSLGRTTIADLHISNIDRGDTFATLPQDFIDGYATISPSLTEQRTALSDALNSEYKMDIIRVKGGESKKHIEVTQSSKGCWNIGDTIKIKGLGGEVISGIIDKDTILATIINGEPNATSPAVVKVNDISGLSVGDTVKRFCDLSTLLDTEFKVDNISGNSITLSWSGGRMALDSGICLVETTASSSSPLVQRDGGNVKGTWSGLGTSEAIFTIQNNDGNVTSEDLRISYSLNCIGGQGGISEVLTDVLGGEINGEKLVVDPYYHIEDDFKGKTSQNTETNPNICLRTDYGSTTIKKPSEFTVEPWTKSIEIFSKLDGINYNFETRTKDEIPQQLFSFNIIDIVEGKYGKIPALSIGGKILWLKSNIKSVQCNWYGHGKSPKGNRANLIFWLPRTSEWKNENSSNFQTHTCNFTHILSDGWGCEQLLCDDGFVHFLVYTDKSDGNTSSAIYTDYVKIKIAFKTPSGFNTLTPENPRRDAGRSNILLINKETKCIEAMFDGLNNKSKLVTYGDYVPYQGLKWVEYEYNDSIIKSDKVFLTTQGTGEIGKIPFAERLFIGKNYRSTLSQGYLEPYMLTNEDIYSNGVYSWGHIAKGCAFESVNLCEHELNIARGGVGMSVFNKEISPNTLITTYELIYSNDGNILLKTDSCRRSSEVYSNLIPLLNRPIERNKNWRCNSEYICK